MKNITFLLGAVVLATILFCGCGEKRVLESGINELTLKRAFKEELSYAEGHMYYQGELFTGIAFDVGNGRDFDGHPIVTREIEYKDGREDGISKGYYEDDGKLASISIRKNYKRVSFKAYYKNGKIKEEGEYDAEGNLIEERFYNENGELIPNPRSEHPINGEHPSGGEHPKK